MDRAQRTLLGVVTIGAAVLSGCGNNSQSDLIATFYDLSDTRFSVQAVAPPNAVRELAVCKAVWFAEKKHVERISLSNPSYGPSKSIGPVPAKVPDGWTALNATAYLNAPSPDGNPMLSVAEKAGSCRQIWDWYR
jgi:hypothetical protein